jgi:hypothetical protein
MCYDTTYIYECGHGHITYNAQRFCYRFRDELYRINDPRELSRPDIPFNSGACIPGPQIRVSGLCGLCIRDMVEEGWTFREVENRGSGL